MKKKTVKFLAMMLCVMTAVAFMPAFAFAAVAPEQNITVTVSGSDKGSMLGLKTLTVSSKAFDEGENAVTIADVVTTYCKAIGKTVKIEYGEAYGWGLTELFGDDSGAFGYWNDNASAYSMSDPVENNGFVSVFVYKDQSGWSDKYSFFGSNSMTACPNKSVTLTLKAAGYDDNWNTVIAAYAGAEVGYYNGSTWTKLGTTDAKGNVSVKFAKNGTYTVTAKGANGEILVPPVCVVTVKHAALKHVKVSAGNLKNGYEYDNCSACGTTKMNYRKLTGWSTNYVKSFKVSKGKKSFTAKWKKQSKKNRKKFSGYQVRYSTSSKMTNAKTVNVSKNSKSKKIKKLAKKKTYYVQARSYVTSKGVNYYAGWSKVKSVKTK